MKVISTLRKSLGLKILLSYMIIILVGSIVLVGTAQFQAPAALDRHIARMQAVLGDDPSLVADLQENFNTAISEILNIAIVVSFFAAVAVSIYTARRIIGPIQVMRAASHHIAEGDYRERIPVSSSDELGELARDFNRMAQELEQIEQRRMELIGDVAHELRTPLSNIRSTMEGLIDEVLPPEPATFLSVQREVSSLQRLIHDLEELSRAEAGQISLDPQPIAINELIKAAADRLNIQFDDKGVSLHLDIRDDLPHIQADHSRITQVLLNLLGNSLQYTPSGGHVTVRVWHVGDEMVVEVNDNGTGIPEDHLPHIFERFYRVDKSRSRAGGGSGVGLTIAKHLVEAHGGRIWAKSPGPEQGSTFTFTLPLVT